MVAKRENFVVVHVAQDELEANVVKSHLESEGIPAILHYDTGTISIPSVWTAYGVIRVLVPEELAKKAKCVIKPRSSRYT